LLSSATRIPTPGGKITATFCYSSDTSVGSRKAHASESGRAGEACGRAEPITFAGR